MGLVDVLRGAGCDLRGGVGLPRPSPRTSLASEGAVVARDVRLDCVRGADADEERSFCAESESEASEPKPEASESEPPSDTCSANSSSESGADSADDARQEDVSDSDAEESDASDA